MHKEFASSGEAVAPTAKTALMERALQELPLPVALCDRERRLIAANQEMALLAASDSGQLLGRDIEEALALGVADPDGVAEMAEQALRTGEIRHLTIRLPAGADVRRVWSITFSPLLSPGEDRAQALAVAFVDETEQCRARRRLAIVDSASERVGRTLDVARTAQELVDVAADEFADFATVDLLDATLDGDEVDPALAAGPLTFRRVAQESVLSGAPESVIPPGSVHTHGEGSPPGVALRTGRASRHDFRAPLVRRWLAEYPPRAESAREHGVHSLLVVPLRARGTTLGIAQFIRHVTAQDFDNDDMLLAQEITARASVCVDNARRYARERDAAYALQRSLLPRLPRRHEAVETAARYQPARDGAGGDWFDVIPLAGSRVAFVIGDVVGHGIPAAATMGKLSTAVRTLADIDLPPDELLTHLDDLVISLQREHGVDRDAAGPGDETGATCLYAVYDPVVGSCTMARAGHPPPGLVTPDGLVSFPELPAGPPLGLGGLPFEMTRLQVPDGSLLAFFTNGVLGGSDQDVDVGLGILRDALERHTGSLEQTCDSVLASVVGQQPSDDLALLLARTRVLDADRVASWSLAAEPQSVGRARAYAGGQLALWGLEDLEFTTELIVSELVTNAVRHGVGPVKLRLIRGAGLTCEVSDGGSAAPRMRRSRVLEEGGRGLLVVASTADRWGTRHAGDGKVIWAEQFLDCPGRDGTGTERT